MDEAAAREFTEFVSARGYALLRVAYALTGDQHAAEDLVQTALAKAMLRWNRLHGGDAEPYVRKIMYNEHVSWWRRRWRRAEVPTAEPPERGDAGDDVPLRLAVREALDTLPPRQRVVVALAIAVAVPATGGGDGVLPAPPKLESPAASVSPSGESPDLRRATGVLPVRTDLESIAPPDLPDNYTVTAMSIGAPIPDGIWLYNRTTRQYVAVGYTSGAPAPTGTRALVRTEPVHGSLALADLADRTVRQLPDLDGMRPTMWSPDGRHLLDAASVPGWVHVYDTDTGVWVDYSFQAGQARCNEGLCAAAWRRDGSLTVPIVDARTGEQTGTQLLSAHGEPSGTLPVKGVIAGACSWSPDGKYVLNNVRPPSGPTRMEITEAVTGRRVATLPDSLKADMGLGCWSSPERLLLPVDGHVKVLSPDGVVHQDIPVSNAVWMMLGPR